MYTYPYILTSRNISKASIDHTFLNRLLHNFYFSRGFDEKKPWRSEININQQELDTNDGEISWDRGDFTLYEKSQGWT